MSDFKLPTNPETALFYSQAREMQRLNEQTPSDEYIAVKKRKIELDRYANSLDSHLIYEMAKTAQLLSSQLMQLHKFLSQGGTLTPPTSVPSSKQSSNENIARECLLIGHNSSMNMSDTSNSNNSSMVSNLNSSIRQSTSIENSSYSFSDESIRKNLFTSQDELCSLNGVERLTVSSSSTSSTRSRDKHESEIVTIEKYSTPLGNTKLSAPTFTSIKERRKRVKLIAFNSVRRLASSELKSSLSFS
jgi:hypothetical protein